jgi:hypothetical protein
MPGVGACGQHEAAEGASERERDAADDVVEAHRARRLPFWGDGQDDSGHGEWEADANTAKATEDNNGAAAEEDERDDPFA